MGPTVFEPLKFYCTCKFMFLTYICQELEGLQASVDKAAEELEEKVRKFDQQRDYELDTIEFEKDSLHERQRQDR